MGRFAFLRLGFPEPSFHTLARNRKSLKGTLNMLIDSDPHKNIF